MDDGEVLTRLAEDEIFIRNGLAKKNRGWPD